MTLNVHNNDQVHNVSIKYRSIMHTVSSYSLKANHRTPTTCDHAPSNKPTETTVLTTI